MNWKGVDFLFIINNTQWHDLFRRTAKVDPFHSQSQHVMQNSTNTCGIFWHYFVWNALLDYQLFLQYN